ncbi:oligosaccharyl transferase alpha subunit [Vararia minispora EC-137]|uniref:Oligosaccharyl transferase alpha subunit n=1 Tax=Vararia minispora EC-137 TaxID=1314806 RepID=A0ACB8QZM1_9AGAM|nr:oligosaccharyl transferase alpha subunit [Vararia minispora EC-137]
MRWSVLSLALSGITTNVLAINLFENTAIVRTIEPAGALVHVTTTYAVKVLVENANSYIFALSEDEASKTSKMHVSLKGQSVQLGIKEHGVQDGIARYTTYLPEGMAINATTNVVVERVLTRAARPWPTQASQEEDQFMKYDGELFVLSPYPTNTQRTKVRAPSSRIARYNTPEDVSFQTDSIVTKSGATITYGPFTSIPISANAGFISKHQRPISVQYHYEHAVVEVNNLVRTAEISHWGANLNVENNLVLHNGGPELKGHFSRVKHQMQMYMGQLRSHVLPAVSLNLPPGARDAYFVDLNGNVSTSRFRPVPSVPKSQSARQSSYLELRPRFPLMGGWNYSHTVGWDQPLADVAAYDPTNGTYIVAVPLLTPIATSVVNDLTFKVIMPEGATDVEVFAPYKPLSVEHSTHISYLDTVGRPAVTLEYKYLTDSHTDSVYVKYKLPVVSHFQKPRAVASAFFVLFSLVFVTRRMDFSIRKA